MWSNMIMIFKFHAQPKYGAPNEGVQFGYANMHEIDILFSLKHIIHGMHRLMAV